MIIRHDISRKQVTQNKSLRSIYTARTPDRDGPAFLLPLAPFLRKQESRAQLIPYHKEGLLTGFPLAREWRRGGCRLTWVRVTLFLNNSQPKQRFQLAAVKITAGR